MSSSSPLLTVVGARPQFIKASPVSQALAKAGITELIVHTGQHYDQGMSDVFFDELGIAPPFLNLNVGSGSHGDQTGKMLAGIEKALIEHKPAALMVYGDTNSTLAGALAAAKLHIPVAHVEAGLRSFNKRMPEEINRILADHASDVLFAPTQTAMQNLANENIASEKCIFIGDVMYSTALLHGERAESTSDILQKLNLEPKKYILATIHRAENTDDPARLRAIFDGLAKVHQNTTVLLPLHPRTQAVLEREGLLEQVKGSIQLTDPVGYLDMVMLEKNAALVATDSGGVQKEAYFHDVPCVTLRDETEWVELVDMSWNRLAPLDSADAIAECVLGALGTRGKDGLTPYGSGDAADLVASALKERFFS